MPDIKRDNVDRRRFIRAVFPYTIHLQTPDGETISSYTEDLSVGGVKVVIREQLSIGSNVRVSIFVRDDEVKCLGKVARVEKKAPIFVNVDFFDTGIAFSGLTNRDELVLTICVQEMERRRARVLNERQNNPEN